MNKMDALVLRDRVKLESNSNEMCRGASGERMTAALNEMNIVLLNESKEDGKESNSF